MASSYTVRRATPDDIDELLRLRALMIELVDGPPHRAARDGGTIDWRVASRALLVGGFTAGTAAAFVAEAGGRLVGGGVGTIQLRLSGPWNPTGRYGEITSMVTEPDWQHQGIAGRVLDLLLAWFVGEGVGRVELMATRDGEPIYRARGFTDRSDRALRWSNSGA
jgi:GNAT superfamily N-acetyltransferase